MTIETYAKTASNNTALGSTSVEESRTRVRDVNNQMRQIMADIANGAGVWVNTVAELRAKNYTADTRPVLVHTTVGSYYPDTSDTASADNGGSVIVDTNGTRWKSITLGSAGGAISGDLTVSGTLGAAALTASGTVEFSSTLSVDGISNFTGGFSAGGVGLFAVGSAAAPAISFTADSNTGVYAVPPDDLRFSVGGSDRLICTGSLFTALVPTSVSSTLSVTAEATFSSTLGVTGATTLSSTLTVAGASTFTGGFTASAAGSFPVGSAASPTITFSGDADTGIYRAAANEVTFTTGGIARLGVTSGAAIARSTTSRYGYVRAGNTGSTYLHGGDGGTKSGAFLECFGVSAGGADSGTAIMTVGGADSAGEFIIRRQNTSTFQNLMIFDIDGGVRMPNAGVSQGLGTINAVGLYDNGVLLSDFVFDMSIDGKPRASDVEDADTAEQVARFDLAYNNPEAYAEYWRDNRHLPDMPSRDEWRRNVYSVGEMMTRLWVTVERQALLIENLRKSIDSEKSIDSQYPSEPAAE